MITKKIQIHQIFIFLIFILSSSYLYSEIGFNQEVYRNIRDQKDADNFEKKSIKTLDLPPQTRKLSDKEKKITDDAKKHLIDFDLPMQSNLYISGRKLIGTEYSKINYKNKDKKLETPSGFSDGFTMNQELQMRIHGTIGNKIRVAIDYNDAGFQTDQQNISIIYTGYKKGDITNPNDVKKGKPAIVSEKDEIVQEVAFGNIELSLPKTEFFGYSKTLFGLRMKAMYKNFNLTLIGSQTEGITEKKVFKGTTASERTSVADTGYLRYKYYKLNFNNSHLPITTNSEEIYLYNQSASQTGVTLYDFEAISYNGSITENKDKNKIFKKLVRGVDYDIDYVDGIIKFKITILSNYVLAVDYIPKNETRKISEIIGEPDKKILLKDSKNSTQIINHELKCYYSMGNTNIVRGEFGKDIIIRILDSNNTEQTFYYSDVEIDYTNGIIKFTDDKFFENRYGYDIYTNPNVPSKYKIEMQYSYEKADNFTFMIGKTIIVGSEEIQLNGKKLAKNIDYIIDYDIGLISMLTSEGLGSDSNLEITYEYLPFGGQNKQTLLGAHGTYSFFNNSHISAGMIFSGSSKPKEAPSVFSTPASITVYDTDFQLNLPKDKTFLPFDIKIGGEFAKSVQNPNIFGKAIVENMESISEYNIAPSNKDSWQIAANPTGIPLDDISKYTLSNANVALKTINPTINDDSDRDVEYLNVNYNRFKKNEEISLVYVINKNGIDYSEKQDIELFVNTDQTTIDNLEVSLTYGQISEDVDGTNTIKTEDLDGDGKLGVNEDIGWEYSPINGIATKIGANNAKLDSSDLNNNGTLDTEGIVNIFTLDISSSTNKWAKITIPLEIDPNNATEVAKWNAVKHLRITLKNKNGSLTDGISGNISFYRIAISGNKWKETKTTSASGKINIRTVNKEIEPNYISISEASNTKAIYEELYGKSDGKDSLNITESALEMQYESLEPATTSYAINRLYSTKKYDLSNYGKIRFFVKSDRKVKFFLHIGADENNYFEYTQTIDDLIDTNTWLIPNISIKNMKTIRDYAIPEGFTDYKGSPRIDNIKYFKVGVINESNETIDGTIYFNDIFVEDVKEKTGQAYKSSVEVTPMSGVKVTGNVKHIDSDFENLTTGTQEAGLASSNSITSGQEIDQYGGTLEISRIKFMPMKFEHSFEEKITPEDKSTAFSISEEGKTRVISNSIATRLLFGPKIPTFDINLAKVEGEAYDIKVGDENPYTLREKQTKDYYYASMQYNIPVTSEYYSQDLSGNYKYQKIMYDYPKSKTAKEELEEKYSAGTNLTLLKNRITLKPKYEYLKVSELRNRQEEDDRFLRKQEQMAELKGEIVFLQWLRPNFTYNVIKKEDYNISDSLTEPVTSKDISMENRGTTNLDIAIASILPKFAPTKSMNFSIGFEIRDINSWDQVDKDYDFMSQWFTRDLILVNKNTKLDNLELANPNLNTKQSNYSKLDAQAYSMRWIPFECLKYNQNWFIPIKTMSTRLSYQYKTIDSLSSYSEQIIWPEVLLGIKSFENLIFVSKYVSNGDMSIKYLKKQETIRQTNDKFTYDFDTGYRFNLLKKFDCALNYKFRKYQEFDLNPKLEQNNLLNTTIEKSYGTQLGFNYKVWRFTTRYDFSRRDEDLVNTTDKFTEENAISLRTDVDFNAKKGLKIPFRKKRIVVENRIKLNSELKGSMKTGSLLADNKNTYSFALNSEYNFTTYLQATLGGEYLFVDFTKSSESGYTATKIKASVSVIF